MIDWITFLNDDEGIAMIKRETFERWRSLLTNNLSRSNMLEDSCTFIREFNGWSRCSNIDKCCWSG